MRGLAWTVPVGTAMLRAGYGPLVGVGGVMMASIYDSSYRLEELSPPRDSDPQKLLVGPKKYSFPGVGIVRAGAEALGPLARTGHADDHGACAAQH